MAGKFVTWLGEDDRHYTLQENEDGVIERNQAPGPSFTFMGPVPRVRFDKDKPVLIDPDQAPSPDVRLAYEHILAKAAKNKFFKVEDATEYDDSDDGEPEDGEPHDGEPEDGEPTKHKPRKVDRKPRLQSIPKRKR